jgi:hypothetical protein
MTIKDDIYTRLSGDAGVTALVGTRIYRRVLPQDSTLPAITYTQVSERPLVNLDGENTTRNARFQFDCFGSTDSAAEDLADALRAAMITDSVFASVRESQSDAYTDDAKQYQVSIDFSIWF